MVNAGFRQESTKLWGLPPCTRPDHCSQRRHDRQFCQRFHICPAHAGTELDLLFLLQPKLRWIETCGTRRRIRSSMAEWIWKQRMEVVWVNSLLTNLAVAPVPQLRLIGIHVQGRESPRCTWDKIGLTSPARACP